jgi:hypothetical protein
VVNNSNKFIFQIRFTNPIEELLEIQSGLGKLVPNEFELDGILCFEMNKRVNFFFLDEEKLYTLKSFLEYLGLRYISFKRDYKEFYDSILFVNQDEFKRALENEILSNYNTDDILDKINKRGINFLTPLDKYILNK